jgi:hypothetical protein
VVIGDSVVCGWESGFCIITYWFVVLSLHFQSQWVAQQSLSVIQLRHFLWYKKDGLGLRHKQSHSSIFSELIHSSFDCDFDIDNNSNNINININNNDCMLDIFN